MTNDRADAELRSERRSEAARLRRLRDVLGLTQRGLAEELGVAHGAVAGWESGKRALPGPVRKLLVLYETELGMHGPAKAPLVATSAVRRGVALGGGAASGLMRAAAVTLDGMLQSDFRAGVLAADARRAIARHLVATLAGLKGFAGKLGQALAHADFAIPDASPEELAELEKRRAPMSRAAVTAIFVDEFGQAPSRMFAAWDAEPFAVGSIGQVHRARLPSGEDVAVKVQHRAIAEMIATDLRSAAAIERLSALIFRGQERGVFLAELAERFAEECDYAVERENQEQFRALWHGDATLSVPRVHAEFSRRSVLVADFAEGDDFAAFTAKASRGAQDAVGSTLFRFAFASIFRHRLFHADPHPSNLRFRGDHVVILDFGCVKRFSVAFIERWRALMRATLERRFEAAEAIWLEAGMVPDVGRYDFAYHRRMLLTLYEPWLTEEFTFDRAFVERTWRVVAIDNPNKFTMNVPKDWVFVNRLQWGLYVTLAHIEATGRFRGIILDLLYAPGEARPAPFSREERAAYLEAAGATTRPTRPR